MKFPRSLALAVSAAFLWVYIFGDWAYAQEAKKRIAVFPFADANRAAQEEGYGAAVSELSLIHI